MLRTRSLQTFAGDLFRSTVNCKTAIKACCWLADPHMFFIFLEEKKREDYENIVCEPSTFAVDLCTPNASRSIFPQLSLF